MAAAQTEDGTQPWLDSFGRWLQQAGFTAGTVQKHLAVASHVLTWAASQRLALDGDIRALLDAFVRHRRHCHCPRGRRGLTEVARPAAGLFLAHLHRLGVGVAEPASREESGLTGAFAQWMQAHRGARSSTLKHYCRIIRGLMRLVDGRVADLNAVTIRSFVVTRAQCYPREAAKVRTVLRAFLRFLAAGGLVPATLVDAVPVVAGWRLAALPRHLPPEAVHRLIASCDARTRSGARDRAVLLLFSRLGLRAGEATGLRLSNLDWDGGTLTVSGKSRRAVKLPLPQDVGDAILAWLRHRPAAHGLDQVFLRLRPPLGPLSSSGIMSIIAKAMAGAGVQSPSHGAHVLRHSLACDLLRHGASLETIAALLRHRSVETTTIYAKVDVDLLAEVAQPWPEMSPC